MMVLEQAFDAGTLHALRPAVRAHAVAAGMPGDRAGDIMLAVHELASNAVLYGGGAGRLHMWRTPGELWCQVDDDGAAGRDGASRAGAHQMSRTGGAPAQWPCQPGHGLWLVQTIADQMNATPGPAGSRVTVMFVLPAARR